MDEGTPQILMVVTGGRSADDGERAALGLKNKGVRIFAVGVGDTENELEKLASDSSTVARSTNIQELSELNEQILETLDDEVKRKLNSNLTGSSLPPPVLTVFPPSSAELQSDKASLLCLSSQSVPFADVSWLAAGSPVSSGISTSTAVQQPDQTFHISSYLSIQTSDWNMDKVYTCKVSLGSQTSEKNIGKSHCTEEE